MRQKTQLERSLNIVRIVATAISLAAIIVAVVLECIYGAHNAWAEAMICVAILGAFELNYASGYIKGLAFKKEKGE